MQFKNRLEPSNRSAVAAVIFLTVCLGAGAGLASRADDAPNSDPGATLVSSTLEAMRVVDSGQRTRRTYSLWMDHYERTGSRVALVDSVGPTSAGFVLRLLARDDAKEKSEDVLVWSRVLPFILPYPRPVLCVDIGVDSRTKQVFVFASRSPHDQLGVFVFHIASATSAVPAKAADVKLSPWPVATEPDSKYSFEGSIRGIDLSCRSLDVSPLDGGFLLRLETADREGSRFVEYRPSDRKWIPTTLCR